MKKNPFLFSLLSQTNEPFQILNYTKETVIKKKKHFMRNHELLPFRKDKKSYTL